MKYTTEESLAIQDNQFAITSLMCLCNDMHWYHNLHANKKNSSRHDSKIVNNWHVSLKRISEETHRNETKVICINMLEMLEALPTTKHMQRMQIIESFVSPIKAEAKTVKEAYKVWKDQCIINQR